MLDLDFSGHAGAVEACGDVESRLEASMLAQR